MGRWTRRFLYFCLKATLLFAFIGGTVAWWYHSPRIERIPERAILDISIGGPLPEGKTLEHYILSLLRGGDSAPLSGQYIESLWKAVEDPRIVGVFVSISDLGPTCVQAQELREVFLALRARNKPVWVYGSDLTTNAYYCASSATRIYLSRGGLCAPTGFCLTPFFMREGLDKLGVEPFVLQRKEYKDFVEMFVRQGSSEESKEAYTQILAGLKKQLEEALTQDGKVGKAADFVDRAPYSAEEAHKLGAVQELCSSAKECRSAFKKSLEKNEKQPKCLGICSYLAAYRQYDSASYPEVAVLYLNGRISDAGGDDDAIDPGALQESLKRAGKDVTVKGIVLRVNSPGGTLIGSELLASIVAAARKKYGKPIVVSMGSVAASGGYWISAPADAIVANAATFTGSIGVGMVFFSTQELMKKLGLAWEVFASHKNADHQVSTRPLSEHARERFTTIIDAEYDLFLRHVAHCRKLSAEEVGAIAKGRVWLGEKACELRLVDKVGGLHTAVQEVCQRAKIAHVDKVSWWHMTEAEAGIWRICKALSSGRISLSSYAYKLLCSSLPTHPTLMAMDPLPVP
ncbi:MAG: signal peptide peptidase SppA [Holosporales bacterium]|jgi:protease-4|nr:signal peptide peptidase SppA [Holosporales bacterium]